MSWFCLLYLSGHHIKVSLRLRAQDVVFAGEKPAVTVTAEVSKAYLCAGRLQV